MWGICLHTSGALCQSYDATYADALWRTGIPGQPVSGFVQLGLSAGCRPCLRSQPVCSKRCLNVGNRHIQQRAPERKESAGAETSQTEKEGKLAQPSVLLWHSLSLGYVQERSQSIEAQLAETTSQLHELRLRQRQLEARNSLLEKVAALNKQQDSDYLRSPSGEQVLICAYMCCHILQYMHKMVCVCCVD